MESETHEKLHEIDFELKATMQLAHDNAIKLRLQELEITELKKQLVNLTSRKD